MLRRFLLGTIAVSALAGTCSTAQEISEVEAQSRFDYSPLTETESDEIAQAQQIASEDKAPGVVAAEAAGPDQAARQSEFIFLIFVLLRSYILINLPIELGINEKVSHTNWRG